MHVYLIPGLGADYTIFSKLVWPESVKLHYLHWIHPLQDETLSLYAKRLSEQMDTTQAFCIVGLSFGGIMVTELNRWVSPKKSIIISSISNRQEFSSVFKLIRAFKLYHLFPSQRLSWIQHFISFVMGAHPHGSKKLLKKYLAHTNTDYIHWAVSKICTWEQSTRIPNLVHIQGSRDKIFPAKYVQADFVIEGGTHMMVYDKAGQVSTCLAKILEPFI